MPPFHPPRLLCKSGLGELTIVESRVSVRDDAKLGSMVLPEMNHTIQLTIQVREAWANTVE